MSVGEMEARLAELTAPGAWEWRLRAFDSDTTSAFDAVSLLVASSVETKVLRP